MFLDTRRFHFAFLSLTTIYVWLVLAPGCKYNAPDREVWAEVGGHPIDRDQVERYYRSRVKSGSDIASGEQALSLKLNLLDELINNQILLDHASRSHVTASEAEVDTRVTQIQSPYTPEEFHKKLSDEGLDMGEFRQEVRQSLIITKLLNKEINSSINVTDVEVADYYNRNKANWNVPETEYHLAQIEVTPFPDPDMHNLKNSDARTPAAASRKIQDLYARLKAGDDFAKLAQEYSEDPKTNAGGGDMGFIPASSINADPQLKPVINSLKVGQFSRVIRTRDGYHIIKLLGREDPGQQKLSDPRVQTEIRRTLLNEKEQLLKAAYIEDLRNRTKVVNYLAQRLVKSGGDPAGLK